MLLGIGMEKENNILVCFTGKCAVGKTVYE